MIVLASACSAADTGSTEENQAARGDEKVLVAYFTHEGNNVYDGDLTDVAAVTSASVQRDGDAFPPQVEDMDSYDVIYLGYPIWYGSFPQAVNTFLEEYDFNGKVIIPFSTHDGSGLGSSVSEIESLCPGADVRDGFSVRNSDVADAKENVIQSINENQ